MAGTIGNDKTKLTIELYDMMFEYEAVRDLSLWKIKVSPKAVLENETIDDICNHRIEVDENRDEYSITSGGPPYRLTSSSYRSISSSYLDLRKALIERLEIEKITVADFIKSFE